MATHRAVRDLVGLVGTYLLLSLVPLLVLSRGDTADLRGLLARNAVAFAIIAAVAASVLVLLLIAWTGLDRYIDILRTPTDPLSFVVGGTFLGAAMSWWVLPAVNQAVTLGLAADELLLAIVAAHVPAILFLSLLTAAEVVGRGP